MSGRVFDDFAEEQDMFLRSSLFDDFTLFCWMDLVNLMHDAFTSPQGPAVVQSFQGNNNKLLSTHYLHVPSLLCCEKSRCHVCRGFVCFWFLLLADANNADRTLCKYL